MKINKTIIIKRSSLPTGPEWNERHETGWDHDVCGLFIHQCPVIDVDGQDMYWIEKFGGFGEGPKSFDWTFINMSQDKIMTYKEWSPDGIETCHLDSVFLELVEKRDEF